MALLRGAGLDLSSSSRVVLLEDGPAVMHVVIPRAGELVGPAKEESAAGVARLVPRPAAVELHVHQDGEDVRFVVLAAADGLTGEDTWAWSLVAARRCSAVMVRGGNGARRQRLRWWARHPFAFGAGGNGGVI